MDAHKNFAYSTVATAPSPATSGTSLVVASGEGTRFPTPPFNATIWPSTGVATPANAEVVRVTNISTDTLTITRAQEGSTARTVVVGDRIIGSITAKTLTDIETLFDDPVLQMLGAPTTTFNFETSDLTGLTTFNSPDTLNANTTVPRQLFIQDNETGENLCGVYAAASAPFTVITKLTDTNCWKDSHAATLFVGVATPGRMELMGIQNAARTLYATAWNSPTSFSGAIGNYGGSFELPMWFAIRVNSTTDLDFLFSMNGYTWAKMVDSRNPSITIGSYGVCINANAAGDELASVWDYIYLYNSAVTLRGAAA